MFILDSRPCTIAGFQRSARAYRMAASSTASLPELTATLTAPAIPCSVTLTVRITRAERPASMPAEAAYGATSGKSCARRGGANSFEPLLPLAASSSQAMAGNSGAAGSATRSSSATEIDDASGAPAPAGSLVMNVANIGEYSGARTRKAGDHAARTPSNTTCASATARLTRNRPLRRARSDTAGAAAGAVHSSATISHARAFMGAIVNQPLAQIKPEMLRSRGEVR